jgi:2-polyprenyl-3-methyl-5-hydroxy-6-metoxy-1,4-benzoquinol methylase
MNELSLDWINDPKESEWFTQLRKSIAEPGSLPSWPSVNTQEIFVGLSNDAALVEAFKFYLKVKSTVGYSREAKILDFGVGWGRILRTFYKDISIDRLHGVDIDPVILEEARRTGVKGDIRLISSKGMIPHGESSMDIIYAFSVFSHISEASAKHWLTDIFRVLRKSGTLIFTTTTMLFLDLCNACKLKTEERNKYEEVYSGIFDDPKSAIRDYQDGKYVFAGVGGHQKIIDPTEYGWAAVPEQWVQSFFGERAIVSYENDGSFFGQGVFRVVKC